MITAYSEEQSDALREIVNVAMGQAANSLARVLNAFVQLPVPRVRLVAATDVMSAITELTNGAQNLTAVRQAFTSQLRGEALVIYGPRSCDDLAPFMGYGEGLTISEREELLLEVSNILVGACLGGIAQQLACDLIFSAPSFITHGATIAEILEPSRLAWARSLLVEVNFRIEHKDFMCHILVFWPEASIDLVAQAVDRLMEGL